MSSAAKPSSLTDVQLRQATTTDLNAILALERATATAPHWPLATYAAILEPPHETAPNRCLIVAEQHATILGFAVGLLNPTEAELETVAVAASARRNGIGRALCTAVFDWCRDQGATSILLEVRATSTAAIALYTSLGFTPEGRRPNYYCNPEDDALILRLALHGRHHAGKLVEDGELAEPG